MATNSEEWSWVHFSKTSGPLIESVGLRRPALRFPECVTAAQMTALMELGRVSLLLASVCRPLTTPGGRLYAMVMPQVGRPQDESATQMSEHNSQPAINQSTRASFDDVYSWWAEAALPLAKDGHVPQ